MNWYLKVLKQYADFEGRARRKEYWMFSLFNLLIFYGLIILGAISDFSFLVIVAYVYILATFVPSLAVGVRRMHDIGKSGWNLLIGAIPLIGGIWLLVLNCTDSERGTNKWGPNPKVANDEIDQIGSDQE